MFWRGITKDIINKVEQCEPCHKYQRKAPKEPMLQPQPPCRPWERLSSDMFQFGGQQYLLLTEKYSRFPIIRRLTSTTSSAVINHLKSIFAEHGIPLQLVTDNGPQYSSAEFDGFMTTYGVEHITSSPMYPNQMGLLNGWSRLWRTFSENAKRTKKILILIFCPTEPHPWTTSSSPPQNGSPTENSKADYPCTSETLLTAVTIASSRRSVSWGAAQKKAREKIKKKHTKGSERTPVGKLNKRSFRRLIWLVVFSCQQMSIRP